MKKICAVSGKEFEVSEQEMALRKKFGFENAPQTSPQIRFQHLGAFWQHWNLHKRKCNKTEKNIISVFHEKCPYPVWHREEWLKGANPPMRDYETEKPVFEQMWALFQTCPIPHRVGTGNQNAAYADDVWYSKNCYLSHSVFKSENLRYSYRQIRMRDAQFCVFSFDSELCVDTINCRQCFELRYALNCRHCQDSSFLYDCRNCRDCLFCFNLRNKQYCIGNKQLTKEAFEQEKKKWNFSSRKVYDQAKSHFREMMNTLAWHRAQYIDRCEKCEGNFLEDSKNCENCFFFSDLEDAVNCVRGGMGVKDALDNVGAGEKSELLYCSENTMDNSYDVKFCFEVSQSRFMEYCGHCFQCTHCFGCCGLVGKKYCIFNKEYSPEEYESLRAKIILQMKEENTWGNFFPGHFSPHPYEESWASFYFPLTKEKQEQFGFRQREKLERRNEQYLLASEIPDSSQGEVNAVLGKTFWDQKWSRPFQITEEDIAFAQKLKIPLSNQYYMARIQENFHWMPFDGGLRETVCAKSGKLIQTTWGQEFDGRILSEEEYLKVVK